MLRCAGWCVLVMAAWTALAQEDPRAKLAQALAREDYDNIRAAVADARKALGDKAGVADTTEQFTPVPSRAAWLTPADARKAYAPLLAQVERIAWWKPGLDPAKLEHALREPASVLAGCAAALNSGLDGKEACLARGKDAAAFLLWAQDQAGTGCLPFPALRGNTRSAAFAAAEKMLAQAEACGMLDKAVHNGWIVEDLGDGGLQFDTGEGGAALFEWHAATQDPACLKVAVRAADWAIARPLVANWNYNSFSVYLLTQAYAATKEKSIWKVRTRRHIWACCPAS